MTAVCDQVAERLALGEPLGELSAHAETCANCRGLVAMSSKLGAAHHAVDPGLGFSARMTVGAQHRLVVRRRRRFAAGIAATVATGALGVMLFMHAPEPTAPPTAIKLPRPDEPKPTMQNPDTPDALDAPGDDELAALVELADTERSVRYSANWRRIKKPLAPYKKLLKGETP